jgi:ferredoxin-NADP reductase
MALCYQCDTVSVVIPAGNESDRPAEGLPAPKVRADAVRNPAQVSFWLLEPVADAAMTYFYAQLFAMDTEIRAMFPAAMDLQRRRFFEAPGRIADAQQSQADRDVYISGPDHMIVKTARVLRERDAPDRLIHYDLDPKAGQGL